jgi:hypothetical protein
LSRFSEEYDIEFSEFDLSTLHSVEFINSLCILKKSFSDKNELGKRIVVGRDELVASGSKELNGKSV